ncbi:hypothetical protein KKG45_06125 [bacterium]|nr:hypothetical protein [bacterium]MBU1072804.1 hypothetical protein [bacterium]MBU1674802.1 hypothetical protein [bacterium]
MDSFDPFVNMLVILTVLSVTAERLTNLLKLQNPDLNDRKTDKKEERRREHRISLRTMAIGVLLAIVVKANFFEIMSSLQDPWSTLGWVRLDDYRWIRSPATVELSAFLYTLGGCLVTGLGLGFGSKFWHDLLGTVYELRSLARNKKDKQLLEMPAGPE